MGHYRSLNDVQLGDVWLTIGAFDGVHRGHRSIIKDLVTDARSHDAPTVMVTFFPHPSEILRGQNLPFYLTSPEEKAEILESLGIDHIITHPFNRQVANKTAREFIVDLNDHMKIRHLGVGYDFAMGKDRSGNITILEQLGPEFDFTIKQSPPVKVKGSVISSSRIRFLLGVGQVDVAADLGDQRGRRLGFPTANLAIWSEKIIPTAGVYASWVKVRGKIWGGVTNIGVRPTFEANPVPPRVETHIIDFDDDIYGESIQLAFVSRIRDEKRFPSIDALRSQIRSDLEKARESLSASSQEYKQASYT